VSEKLDVTVRVTGTVGEHLHLARAERPGEVDRLREPREEDAAIGRRPQHDLVRPEFHRPAVDHGPTDERRERAHDGDGVSVLLAQQVCHRVADPRRHGRADLSLEPHVSHVLDCLARHRPDRCFRVRRQRVQRCVARVGCVCPVGRATGSTRVQFGVVADHASLLFVGRDRIVREEVDEKLAAGRVGDGERVAERGDVQPRSLARRDTSVGRHLREDVSRSRRGGGNDDDHAVVSSGTGFNFLRRPDDSPS
jgi:hypothetical protein